MSDKINTNKAEQFKQQLAKLNPQQRALLQKKLTANTAKSEASLCLHQRVEAKAQQHGQETAVVFDDDSLSYAELNEQANKVAHYLLEQGVKSDTVVGICIEYISATLGDRVIAMLGVLKAGGAWVMIDPEWDEDRIDHIVEHSGINLLLTQSELLSDESFEMLKMLPMDNDIRTRLLGRYSEQNPDSKTLGHTTGQLAYVSYADASTATEGVMTSHRNIAALLNDSQFVSIAQKDVVGQLINPALSLATFEILAALCSGAKLVAIQSNICALAKQLKTESVSLLAVSAAMFNRIADEQADAFATLRYLLVSGEPKAQALAQVNANGKPQNLLGIYGSSETCGISTFVKLTSDIGKNLGDGLAGVKIYVLDEYGAQSPTGVVGELHIGGPIVGRGYWQNQTLTDERFINNPFAKTAGQQLFKTGDLVRRMADASLVFVGKLANQIKVDGLTFNLAEVADALIEHPQLTDARVVVTGDESKMAAYVVAEQMPEVEQDFINELNRWLSGRIEKAMVPVGYKIMSALPLNENDDVNHSSLPEPIWFDECEFVPPTTELEIKLATIWQELLSVEKVSLNDNFFSLGGNSLTAIRLEVEIMVHFNVKVTIMELFEAADIVSQVKLIETGEKKNEIPQIVPVARDGKPLPLSFAQQRLWFIDQFEGAGNQYNMPLGLKLSGQLNVDALKKSLNDIIVRHEVLRTVYLTSEAGVAHQQVLDADNGLELVEVDFSAVEAGLAQEQVQAYTRIEAEKPFDLANDLMIRACLLKEADEEHTLLITMHHIATDGWSLGVFIYELGAMYNAHIDGRHNMLQPMEIQYADFASWQREWQGKDFLAQQMDFWQKRLEDLPQVHSVPLDKTRPKQQTFAGAVHCQQLDKNLNDQLNQLSLDNDSTLFMTLQLAFALLVSRYSNETDIVMGTPVANRTQTEVSSLIGFFVNTLVLRNDLSGDPSFVECLQRSKTATLEAFDHQHVPFEMLVEKHQQVRNLCHSPLFQLVFILQNNQMEELTLSGLNLKPVEQQHSVAKFDLSLSMQESEQGLTASWEYNTDLFEAVTIERMAQSFALLLEGIIAAPHSKIIDLPLQSDVEQQQLLASGNGTISDYPTDLCIHQMFERQAQATPYNKAVVFSGHSLTYRQLNERANQVAHYLIENGIKPDMPVGICADRSLDTMVGVLGILKAGGAYVPLDPNYPVARIEHMLSDSGATIVLTQPEVLKRTSIDADISVFIGNTSILGLYPTTSPDVAETMVKPSNLAYVIYTSGSTGLPKGVMVEHQGAVSLSCDQRARFGVDSNSRVIQFASMSFDAATWEWLMALLNGAELHICTDLQKQTPVLLQDYMVESKITHATLPPALLPHMDVTKPYSLKSLVVAGEACDEQLAQLWGSHYPMFNAYGPTETTVCASIAPVVVNAPLTIGKAISNTRLYVLDKKQRPVPKGVVGELYVAGISVARGYINQPEMMGSCFIADPYGTNPSIRCYRTGDLVRIGADGNLVFIGRVDEQIKIRGFRIEPGEISNVLTLHENISESLVAVSGEGSDKQLIAYLVAHKKVEDEQVLISDMRQWLANRIPEYMQPTSYIVLDTFPLTVNGKVNRKALPLAVIAKIGYVAPANEIEQQLTDIWSELLSIENISTNASFFELGGHSLLVTRLVSAIKHALSVELSVRQIFDNQTIIMQAKVIATAETVKKNNISVVSRDQNLQLSFAQQRLWFVDKLQSSSHYNMPTLLSFEGGVDHLSFERALGTIVARHEVLRTNFFEQDGQAFQRIREAQDFILEQTSLIYLSADEQQLEVNRLVRHESEHAFDLGNDLMLRAQLLTLDEQHHLLLITTHHIAFDGWSMGVFTRELNALYSAYVAGQDNPLTMPAIQYADFAQWQRNWLQGEVQQSQLDYWRTHLGGIQPVHSLPLDKARPEVQSFVGVTCVSHFDPVLTEQVRAICKDNDVTMFMFLQTAFSVLIARYSNDTDVVMGTPIAGRAQQEVEPLIGFFLNNLVLRCNLHGNPDFEQLLASNKQSIIDAYSHQYIPFEMLVDELNPERNFNHNALYQIVFALQNFEQGELDLSGLTFKPYQTEDADISVDYELGLHVTELADELMLEWTCNTSVFLPETLQRFADGLKELVKAIVDMPTQKVQALPILDQSQRKTLLTDWNDTQRDYPYDSGIHQLVEQQVAVNPQSTAIIFEGETLSYQTLNEQANQVAHYLLEQGVKPGTLIGLCMESSIDLVVGMLAILKAGGAYVPIAPNLPEERIDYLVEDAEISWVLAQDELIEDMPFEDLRVLALDSRIWQRVRGKYSIENPDCFANASCANELAYVIYTSGSTGQPKGVMVNHHNVVGLVRDQHYVEIGVQDVVAHAATPAFDAATFEIWGALCNGASVAYIDKDTLLNPEALEQKLIDDSVSVMFLTTALVNQVAYERPALLRHLSCLLFGGEQVNYEAVQRILDNGKPTKLLHVYGPTETTTFATYAELTGNYKADGRLISIGGPLSNVQTYVLDEYGQLSAMGAVGELYIGGRGVSRGYLNQAELTDERFIANPFAEQTGSLYRTGDQVRWLPTGELEFVGRVDHQVKVRGFRIELGEIEHQLTSFPDVKESVVIVHEQSNDGASPTKQLAGYVAGTDLPQDDEGKKSLIERLRNHLHAKLPEHMVPSVFVVLESMPLTTNGKIDRKALPEPKISEVELTSYFAPRNDIEQVLCDVWKDVLAIEKVGINDNFFNLGGDSILSIRIVSKVNELHNGDGSISVKDIFKYQTVEKLATYIETGGDNEISNIQVEPFSMLSKQEREALGDDKVLYEDVYPMSELQTGMVFHSQLQSDSEDYHNIFSIQIKTRWDHDCFVKAMSYLFACHPALRTGFYLDGERPLQRIYKTVDLPLTFKDISDMSETEQNQHIVDWVELEKTISFNWTGPLFKVFVHKRSKQSIQFGLKFHHGVIDGWSDSMFVSQLFIHYQTLLAGNTLPEAVQEFVFRDFVAQEIQILKNPKAKIYWQSMLEEALMQQIPCKSVVEQHRSRVKKEYGVDAFFELSGLVLQLAKDQGVPVQSVLLATHSKVLSMLSGESHALTSIVVNGRPEYEGGDKGIGLFLNSIPVCFELAEGSWADLIQSVGNRMTDTMAYRHYPSSAIQRDTGRSFAEVVFNYTHFHAYEDLADQSDMEFSDGQGFGQTNFDFTINFSRAIGLDKLKLTITFDEDMYDSALIEQIGEYYVNAFNAMLADIEQSHNRCDMLIHNQSSKLLCQYNDTKKQYPSDCGIHQLFEDQVKNHPNTTALVFEQYTLSYGELNQKANQVAYYLQELGIKPNTLIALCMTRSLDMFIGILGILKAGCAYVPIDMDSPQERINYLLEDSNVNWILTQNSLANKLNTSVQNVCMDSEQVQKELAACPSDNIDLLELSNQLAYVIYTSGSTGLPKGVMIEHQGLCNFATRLVNEFDINTQSRVLQFASIAFDASIYEWTMALCGGGQLYLPSAQTTKSLDDLGAMVQNNILTHMILTPALLPQLNINQFTSVTHLMVGGEACSRETAQLWSQNRRFYNAYGPTECTIMASIGTFETGQTNLHLGKPIDNVQMYVVNQGVQLLPEGVVGELLIGGVGLARGYLNRAELTQEKFVNNPFTDEHSTRLYKTGDMVRWLPDGNLEFVGRIDTQVKLRGLRIELGEIEHQLHQCNGIKDAVVVARNEGIDKQLVAYLVHEKNGSDEEKALLLAQCRSKLQVELPLFMMPSVFVWLDSMPLTLSCKINYKALPAPELAQTLENTYVAPENETEHKLTKIWQETLDKKVISVEDQFFMIGGHSLLAMKLVAKIKVEFSVEIALFELMHAQTIRSQAELIFRGGEGKVFDLLVEIQCGDTDSNNVPMYMVPGFAGYSHIFSELASNLGKQQSVYAFNPSGLDGKSEVHCSVEAAAEHYVERLLQHQNEGPYVLLGYSMGAAVAFEMVKLLQTKFHQPAQLIVLDGYAEYKSIDEQDISVLDDSLEEDFGDSSWTEGMEAVIKAQSKWSYHSDSYQLDDLLVLQSADCDIHLGNQWQKYVADTVNHHMLEGGHQSILQAPCVTDVAYKIIEHRTLTQIEPLYIESL